MKFYRILMLIFLIKFCSFIRYLLKRYQIKLKFKLITKKIKLFIKIIQARLFSQIHSLKLKCAKVFFCLIYQRKLGCLIKCVNFFNFTTHLSNFKNKENKDKMLLLLCLQINQKPKRQIVF